jgi:FtsH-binding integral membrane protein
MLEGGPFVPNEIRVNGTYAFFSYFLLKLLGHQSWNIILIQFVLGVLTGILAFLTVDELTHDWRFGAAALLLVSIRIRGLFYEHILLAETVYDFLGVLFCWICVRVYLKPTLLRFCLLSAVTVSLVFARAQGWVFVAAEAMLIGVLWRRRNISWKTAASFISVALLPLLFAVHAYVSVNRKHHRFSGLSAAGNYNLFWVATSRYLDFRSDRHRELKQALEPCIRDANQNHANDLAWGTPGPICAPVVTASPTGCNPTGRLPTNSELSREAILAHPLEVAYRFLWNVGDFLFVRRTVFRTIDLDPLLFESNRARLRIDPAKAAATRSMDPLALGQPVPAQHAEGSFQTVIGFLKPFVWNTVVFVLLAFSIFVTVCNRNDEIGVLLILVLIWAGQVGVTLFAVNALYDRYYLFPEALAVILIAAGCVPLLAWDGARRNGISFLSQRPFHSGWRYFSSLERSSPGSCPSSTARLRDCRLPALLSINRPS